ncbi:hypothetical protein N7462_000685 [Penicillium macrosclerotiorum]|uniref:uncharacterized protein n=1 Tax=Penicillium macrosclerotiorum TaxID=303699 RepID=UPI002547BAE0|nr:uncharacterized protein N7462_000685 [Penicillium macrosclerotiorum]KAJ5698680.1 hypothetical protein N7462_000685 [Penicillium macrosclerotiorum]
MAGEDSRHDYSGQFIAASESNNPWPEFERHCCIRLRALEFLEAVPRRTWWSLLLAPLIAYLSDMIYWQLHEQVRQLSSSEDGAKRLITAIIQRPSLLQWKYLVRGWSQGIYKSLLDAIFASHGTTLPSCGITYNQDGDCERILLATCGVYAEYEPSHGSEGNPDQWTLYQAWIKARIHIEQPRPACNQDSSCGMMSIVHSTWLTCYARSGIFAHGIAGNSRDVVWSMAIKSGMCFTSAEEYASITLCQLMGQIQHRGNDLSDGFAAAGFIRAYRRRFESMDSSCIVRYGVNLRLGAFSCIYQLGRFAPKAVELLDGGSVCVSSSGRTAKIVASDPPIIEGCPSVMFDAWVHAVELEEVTVDEEASQAWDRWLEVVFDRRKTSLSIPVRCSLCHFAISGSSGNESHPGCIPSRQ